MLEREVRVERSSERGNEVAERLAESQVHSLLEKSNAVPWQARADTWQITRIGAPAVRLFGYPLDRWYEREFWISHIHPDDRDRVVESYRRHTAQGQDFEIEYRMISSGGQSVWVHAVVNVTCQRGRRKLLRGIFTDISEHRRFIDTLCESQQRYALATSGGGVSVWDYDPATDHLCVDKAMPLLLGFEAGELRSRADWLALIHPADRDRVLDRERMALSAATPADDEGVVRIPHTKCRVYHRDGSIRWFLHSGVVLRSADGTLQRIIGTVTDVTARVREARARRAAGARLRAVLASLPGHVALLDRSGVIVAVNQGWRRLARATGADPSRRAFIGTSYLEICRRAANAGDQSAAAALTGIESVLNGSVRQWSCEYESALQSERHRFVARARRLARPAGGVLISHFDVTGSHWAEQHGREVAHMARLAKMGELAASLAHELNQPLAGMMSNAQTAARLLATDEPSFNEVRAILADIVEDSRRAGEVTRSMRALLGCKEVVFAPLSLNDLVRDTRRLLNSDAIIRQTTLSMELDPRLPLGSGDHVQLQQVVLNLIVNGLDAVGDVPLGVRQVVVRTQQVDSETIELAVMDNGPGISPTTCQHMFEPFYTTKRDGMGLGLSIARSIVEAHGGIIQAENLPESGTVLRIRLPTVGSAPPVHVP
jgi:PAS domain S-box-containing protein